MWTQLIRGKLPNAYKEGRAKFLSNPEVAGIINIIGAGYGRDFNIDKCKFDKIIIFADADADKLGSVRLDRNVMIKTSLIAGNS